ncbi:MAG TPA: DUF6576 domain-containing protein [Phycisphaerales bacterium]|nr:DUF6576 domain-containing protein [Phycisphaerales bacterium]
MGFGDRRYRDPSGGRFRAASERVFAEGAGPLSWSLWIGRVAGIDVRVHLFFILFIAFQLIQSLLENRAGVGYTAAMLGGLFFVVFLHELGHCFACRWVGGEAHQILMWPLGGLAMVSPPHRWSAALVTTVGGPAVNVLLIPVLGGVVYLLTRSPDLVFFNPFRPDIPWNLAGSWLDVVLIWLHVTNFYMLLFNVLLPMFPLDGGRIVQEILWWRLGYHRSMWIATNLGLILACVLFVYAITSGREFLSGIAIFAGITCWIQRQNLAFMVGDAADGFGSPGWRGTPSGPRPDRAAEQARKAHQAEARHQVEVDRILGKIATQGMGSLTRAEKKTLAAETDRRRGS